MPNQSKKLFLNMSEIYIEKLAKEKDTDSLERQIVVLQGKFYLCLFELFFCRFSLVFSATVPKPVPLSDALGNI